MSIVTMLAPAAEHASILPVIPDGAVHRILPRYQPYIAAVASLIFKAIYAPNPLVTAIIPYRPHKQLLSGPTISPHFK